MSDGVTREEAPSDLLACTACPRLVDHRERVAVERRAAYRNQPYWGRPVPGFGDPRARLVLVGLAPGAHGSNRTGRQFTGDASGNFLFPALHRAGWVDRPDSTGRLDGLQVSGVWITAAARCVPPANRPTREELANCRRWLRHDLALLSDAKVVLAVGNIAHDAVLDVVRDAGAGVVKAHWPFAHGSVHVLSPLVAATAGIPALETMVDTYHVSFQNTNTGRLTVSMFDEVLATAGELAGLGHPRT